MSNLFATLRTSTSALSAITEAVGITQNNVTNAGSAGYAKQRVTLLAREFDPGNGYAGGVAIGDMQNARDEYVERMVRTQEGRLAKATASTTSLTKLEQITVISTNDSIPAKINQLFQAFSAWAVAPDAQASKENVFSAAGEVATAFRNAAQKLNELTEDNSSEIRSVTDAVNRLAGRIRDYNEKVRNGAISDAGVDAGIHATLDELAKNVNVEAVKQEDGTFTLLLGGEHPLVIGERQYEITATFTMPSTPPPANPDAVPPAKIVGSDGQDLTASIRDSELSSLIDFRHGALAEIQGDANNAGELNRLAQHIADRINDAWPPPSQPFFVSGLSAVAVAHTLSVNPALAPAMLDAVEPGPPPVANGKALKLAALANPTDPADKLDGLTIAEFYGNIASNVGQKLNDAEFDQEAQAQLAAQANAFRNQISGVNLDEEAVHMIEFQRAYEASARMISAIDELMEIAVNLGRQ